MNIVYAITKEQLDRLKTVHMLLAREIENQNVYRPVIEQAFKDGKETGLKKFRDALNEKYLSKLSTFESITPVEIDEVFEKLSERTP